jgi:hypothetical protein
VFNKKIQREKNYFQISELLIAQPQPIRPFIFNIIIHHKKNNKICPQKKKKNKTEIHVLNYT